MSNKPTITDVAKHACGADFDRYAMNARLGGSATTAGRLLASANDLGWRPNTNTRSMITSSGAHPFIPAFIRGVELIRLSGIAAATSAATYPRLSGSTRHRRGGLLPIAAVRAAHALLDLTDRPRSPSRTNRWPRQEQLSPRNGLPNPPRDVPGTRMDGSEISQYAYPALVTGGNGCYSTSIKWATRRTSHSRPRSSSCVVRQHNPHRTA